MPALRLFADVGLRSNTANCAATNGIFEGCHLLMYAWRSDGRTAAISARTPARHAPNTPHAHNLDDIRLKRGTAQKILWCRWRLAAALSVRDQFISLSSHVTGRSQPVRDKNLFELHSDAKRNTHRLRRTIRVCMALTTPVVVGPTWRLQARVRYKI